MSAKLINDYKVNVQDLIISNKEKNKSIYGKLHTPEGNEKFPAIIFSHGYNGDYTNYEYESEFFAAYGFITYHFDFCGGSNRSKSSGKSTDMTIFTEKEDLLDVFNYISSMEHVDKQNIYLVGGSQGGLVTALAAEEIADKINGVVLYFPAFNIPDDWREKYPSIDDIPDVTDFWELKLGKEFFTAIHNFNPYETISKFNKDILIIQGDSDDIVKQSYSEKTASLYDKSQLIILKDEGHGFSDKGNKIAMEKALDFLQKTLK